MFDFVSELKKQLTNVTLGYDINSNQNPPEQAPFINIKKGKLSPLLPQLSKPILTLFLSKGLTEKDSNRNIPNLEYQVLTDYPIGSSKMLLTATVVVDGNVYRKVLTKEMKKPLIDFAIQN